MGGTAAICQSCVGVWMCRCVDGWMGGWVGVSVGEVDVDLRGLRTGDYCTVCFRWELPPTPPGASACPSVRQRMRQLGRARGWEWSTRRLRYDLVGFGLGLVLDARLHEDRELGEIRRSSSFSPTPEIVLCFVL